MTMEEKESSSSKTEISNSIKKTLNGFASNGKTWKIIKNTLIGLAATTSFLAVGAVGVGLGVLSAYGKDIPLYTKEDYQKQLGDLSQNSYVYFRSAKDGKPVLLGTMLSSDDRDLVKSLNDVSPYLINAFLSVEDRDFYSHHGINPKGIMRAAWQLLTGSQVQTGGSTITQQLVKLEVLEDRERNIERKAKEIIHALRMEHYFSKDEILIAYMNSIHFGRGANKKLLYGVAAAARGIFNKDVKDLNLPEAAYIAGMVQRPWKYNPFYNSEETIPNGIKRMRLVLKAMLDNGKITEKEYQEAIHYDIRKSFAKPQDFKNSYSEYPFVINAVEREAIDILKEIDKKNGNKERINDKDYVDYVRKGGLHIYTTIDKGLYDAMNKAASHLDYGTRTYKGQKVREQIGAVLIKNDTGEILAFNSGTDFDQNQQDHALQVKNQPGSAMKPLLAYGPAIDQGIITPNSIIIDEPITKEYSSDVYINYDNRYHGPVTATTALAQSFNIPAIKVFRATVTKIGKEGVFDYLRKMDMPPDKHDGEALVLGGATVGFTVKQMTAAYAAIANNGIYIKPHLIDKITDSSGKVIYQFNKEENSRQVFKPETAAELHKMMREVVRSGTASALIGSRVGGYDVIGKTGTTTNEVDLWFIGSTPEVTLGVWSGYDYNLPASHNLAKEAWVKLFLTAANKFPFLIPKGTHFNDANYPIQEICFECNKVPPVLPGQNQNQQQGQPVQPGGSGQSPQPPVQQPPAQQPPVQQPPVQQPPATSPNPPQSPNQGGNPGEGSQPPTNGGGNPGQGGSGNG